MRNLLIIIVASISFYTNAQDNTFIIKHELDTMTKEHYYYPEKKLVISNENYDKGFCVIPHFEVIEGRLKFNALFVESFPERCVEKGTLYILLETGFIMKSKSWNNFNCKGVYYFDVSNDEAAFLSESNIKLIRLVNETDSSEFEASPSKEQRNYFINMFYNHKIIEVK
jgi:hypothetical protein